MKLVAEQAAEEALTAEARARSVTDEEGDPDINVAEPDAQLYTALLGSTAKALT